MANFQDSVEVQVPGRLISDQHERETIQKLTEKVRELCGWRMRNFPGSQPVSLAKNNVTSLGRNHYVACEKSDGVRYLMLLANRRVYLVDRMETVQEICMFLPHQMDSTESHQLTLLDGEMVTDQVEEWKVDDEGNKVLAKTKTTRFLVYDAVSIHRDINVARLPLLDRLKQVYERVIQPRLKWEENNPELWEREKAENRYLPLFLKDFFEIWDIAAIMQFGSKRLPHLCDGIIFTPVFAPYVPGTCHGLLKWKPPHMNTVDFRAEVVRLSEADQKAYNALADEPIDPKYPFSVKLLVGVFGIAQWQGDIWCSPKGEFYKSMLEKYAEDGIDGAIWECMYDVDVTTPKPRPKWDDNTASLWYNWNEGTREKGGWVVERVRTDRRTPNDKRVVKSVLRSIQDGISFLDLLEYIEGIRSAGKTSLSSRVLVPEHFLEFGSRYARDDAANNDQTRGKKRPAETPVGDGEVKKAAL